MRVSWLCYCVCLMGNILALTLQGNYSTWVQSYFWTVFSYARSLPWTKDSSSAWIVMGCWVKQASAEAVSCGRQSWSSSDVAPRPVHQRLGLKTTHPLRLLFPNGLLQYTKDGVVVRLRGIPLLNSTRPVVFQRMCFWISDAIASYWYGRGIFDSAVFGG